MHNVNYEKYERADLIKAYEEKLAQHLEEVNLGFEKLNELVEEDLKPIDKDKLIEESNRNISKYHRYLSKLTEYKLKMKTYKERLASMEAELVDYYKFNWDKSTKLSSNDLISKYVHGHRVYIALNSLVRSHEIIIEHLEGVVNNFSQRNWTIKNIIEIRKLELGLGHL